MQPLYTQTLAAKIVQHKIDDTEDGIGRYAEFNQMVKDQEIKAKSKHANAKK